MDDTSHRHLGPDCYHERGLSLFITDQSSCSRTGAQYCMLARSTGDVDNCRRHEMCGVRKFKLNHFYIFFYQNPKVSSRTQIIQSTRSTFTSNCTMSVHIHHIACFIYSFSLLTSSEPIRKVLKVSQTFKYTHVCMCVSY